MDNLQAAYIDEEENDDDSSHIINKDGINADDGIMLTDPKPSEANVTSTTIVVDATENPSIGAKVGEGVVSELLTDFTVAATSLNAELEAQTVKEDLMDSEDMSSDSISIDDQSGNLQNLDVSENLNKSPDPTAFSDDDEVSTPKKQKRLSLLTPQAPSTQQSELDTSSAEPSQSQPKALSNGKKSKKKSKNNNVWTKSMSRKGKKKCKNNNHNGPKPEDKVLIKPVPRLPDKNDDNPDMKICLSKIYKAEKVELSDDRMTAGSCKGYRMVRATRGVAEGAWYFEIKLMHLGDTGHARLGWSTEKGDLQAPVGYDANSFGYRDIDGSKIHKAWREKYGEEGYKEGDVIGFYINLPEGNSYMPKPPQLVWYKGQRYLCAPDAKEDPPKIVPRSEISFFKNGTCQGVAFENLYGGRYYPAASMFTLPNQTNCFVRFNFGPDFECFPEDFEGRPVPKPMIEVPYHGVDIQIENSESNERE
ncbi:hypothetical protein Nepgr_013311 [Nepenthes gracilis]|uniref:B30.2/SPRY domain-containing protein n=1 Tax=Nepenthes gracilis TaxID=150966 RepID=A0AAD3SIL4_NEPGR|nr:hypothetical protein Nepgr_013311 [Nepenthes gracilis]